MKLSHVAWVLLIVGAFWTNRANADHWCDHLFQPSQFYVLPSHHTGYSPLHYWCPRLWNAKAYHHGLHRQSGCQYHFPDFSYEVPAQPIADNDVYGDLPLSVDQPQYLPESARETLPFPAENK